MMKASKKARVAPKTKNGVVFSRFNSYAAHARKAMLKAGFTPEQIDDFSSDVWKQSVKKCNTQSAFQTYYGGNPGLFASDLILTFLAARKRWHNLYILDENVVDFLENNKIYEKDAEAISQIVKDRMSSFVDGLMIHFAGRKQSILARYSSSKENDLLASLGVSDLAMCLRGCKGEEDDIRYNPVSQRCISEEQDEPLTRILFNLCLYMDAFPECVIDGPPQLICGSVEGESSSKLETHAAIAETYREQKRSDTKSPHFRRGHFRILRSSRFTNKRYQAVYVRPTMVKSTAETVVAP